MKNLLEHFIKNSLQKASQKEFRIGKVIKRKGTYVKWKDYDNLFNNWINMKGILKG